MELPHDPREGRSIGARAMDQCRRCVSKFRVCRVLMEHLGESGTFLIWSLHENTVLNTISRHMHRCSYSDPELEKWLDTVTSREGHPSPFMVDMCALAKEGYFHPKMKGKLSLKYVLPAV